MGKDLSSISFRLDFDFLSHFFVFANCCHTGHIGRVDPKVPAGSRYLPCLSPQLNCSKSMSQRNRSPSPLTFYSRFYNIAIEPPTVKGPPSHCQFYIYNLFVFNKELRNIRASPYYCSSKQ